MKNRLACMIYCLFLALQVVNGQTYDSWRLGNTESIEVNHLPGVVMAGGGADNDHGMKWMLERANGGDVVIIRATGADGYNSYFFNALGVNLNSVETIRINNRAGANDAYVERRIREAEVLFIAGGNQTTYFNQWRNTAAHRAITYLIEEKGATIGGTSAGMAILSDFFYVPDDQSATSEQALGNPFHPNITIGHGNFLNIPILSGTITDQHFDQRTRQGRTVAFLARIETSFESSAKGIAANERTAICVDENGIARVFGRSDRTDTFAYFLQSNCDRPESIPEVCLPNTPLTWKKQNDALKVYRILGDDAGSHSFDLNTWTSGQGGSWWHWWADNGSLQTQAADGALCKQTTSTQFTSPLALTFTINPNPSKDTLRVVAEDPSAYRALKIINLEGKLMHFQTIMPASEILLPIHELKSGQYILILTDRNGGNSSKVFIKQ
jgi:cyanophycinase